MPVRSLAAGRLLAGLGHAFGEPAAGEDPPAAPPEALTRGLRQAGLGVPVWLLLQLQAPLLFIYGQLLRAGAAAWPGSARWAALLEDPARLRAWLAALTPGGDDR